MKTCSVLQRAMHLTLSRSTLSVDSFKQDNSFRILTLIESVLQAFAVRVDVSRDVSLELFRGDLTAVKLCDI